MSQQNTRFSYASIAGGSTNPRPLEPTSPVPAPSSVTDDEEFPPVSSQSGLTRQKRKQEGNGNTGKTEIDPLVEKMNEYIERTRQDSPSPNLEDLCLNDFIDVEPKPEVSPKESEEPDSSKARPKTWAELFKKAEQPGSGKSSNVSTPVFPSPQDPPYPTYEPNNGDTYYVEEGPSCSMDTRSATTDGFTQEPPVYYPMMNYPSMMASPQQYGIAYIPNQFGYQPVQMFPNMFYSPPNFPMHSMGMGYPPQFAIPNQPIAHTYHGTVYYQYENETPAEQYPMYASEIATSPPSSSKHPPTQSNTQGDGWNSAVDAMKVEQKIAGKIDLILCDRYQTYLKISRGSCGTVFAAIDLQNRGRQVAIKFEEHSESKSNLVHEFDVYKACSLCEMNGYVCGTQNEGFARIYWMGSQFKYRILIMQLLGPSLENLFSFAMKQFSMETIYRLGIQMVNRIETLHRAGYVHRDIKPDNFVMGLGNLESKVFLIDFGLSRRFRTGGDEHPVIRKDKALVGTAKYASINSHKGFELTRRDDAESIAYILVEFINGELPWKPENWKNSSREILYKNMFESKKNTNWTVKCPEMAEWLTYVLGLEFNAKPDYDYLRRLLLKLLEQPIKVKPAPLTDHLMKVGRPKIPRKESIETTKLSLAERAENMEFEWITRRECCLNDKYSYQCLYRWTLPYGHEPQRPPGDNPSNVFGYGFGEGGFA